MINQDVKKERCTGTPLFLRYVVYMQAARQAQELKLFCSITLPNRFANKKWSHLLHVS